MKFINGVIGIVLVLSLFSCKSRQETGTTKKTDSTYFIIGEGGGFTGEYTQYKIEISGGIYKYDFSKNNYQRVKKANPQDVAVFFKQIEINGLADYFFNRPGNYSRYLEFIDTANNRNRIVWSMGSTEVNSKITDFYKAVNSMINNTKGG